MSKKKAKGQGAGKPRKYPTVEELQTAINSYFSKNRAKPTISGLALHLGFADRQSIYDQMKIDDEYSCSIRSAITKIESIIEKMCLRAAPTQGVIFWLKSHSNARAGRGMWCDKQDIDVTTGGEKIQQTQIIVNSASAAKALKDAVTELGQ